MISDQHSSGTTRTSRRSLRLALCVAAAIVIAASTGQALRYRSRATLKLVIPHRVYRSGQPTSGLLRRASDKGVRRVVNLRGDNSGARWYLRERAEVLALGMSMKDIRFQGLDAPPRIEVHELVKELEDHVQPLLLHCADGWDRTGWASAVARLLNGVSLERALVELSPVRGHLCIQSRCHFHQFFEQYEKWLATKNLSHSATTFRRWIDGYAPDKYLASIALEPAGPMTAAPGEKVALSVTLRNDSPMSWQASGQRAVKAGIRILPGATDEMAALRLFRKPNGPARDLGRGYLPADLKPGQRVTVDVPFEAPAQPGPYVLHVDAVEEGVHWFSDLGREGRIVFLTVE